MAIADLCLRLARPPAEEQSDDEMGMVIKRHIARLTAVAAVALLFGCSAAAPVSTELAEDVGAAQAGGARASAVVVWTEGPWLPCYESGCRVRAVENSYNRNSVRLEVDPDQAWRNWYMSGYTLSGRGRVYLLSGAASLKCRQLEKLLTLSVRADGVTRTVVQDGEVGLRPYPEGFEPLVRHNQPRWEPKCDSARTNKPLLSFVNLSQNDQNNLSWVDEGNTAKTLANQHAGNKRQTAFPVTVYILDSYENPESGERNRMVEVCDEVCISSEFLVEEFPGVQNDRTLTAYAVDANGQQVMSTVEVRDSEL